MGFTGFHQHIATCEVGYLLVYLYVNIATTNGPFY